LRHHHKLDALVIIFDFGLVFFLVSLLGNLSFEKLLEMEIIYLWMWNEGQVELLKNVESDIIYEKIIPSLCEKLKNVSYKPPINLRIFNFIRLIYL
jgi:hypothetical protein